MKILVAGDLHFDKERFEHLVELTADSDVLCLTGDCLNENVGDRNSQIEWVSKWIARVTIPVLMCSGNHDLDEVAECEWIDKLSSSSVITDNAVWRHKGVTFGIIPYIGAHYSTFSKCDIILSHLPPSRTRTSRKNGTDYGDDELYFSLIESVLTPKYVLCGHVHSPDAETDRIKETTIINASSGPVTIDI
jgi:Icc-related predicted phosphoesterase